MFKAQYDALSDAIRRKKKVFLTTAAKAAMEISPLCPFRLQGRAAPLPHRHGQDVLPPAPLPHRERHPPARRRRISRRTGPPCRKDDQIRPAFACRTGEGTVLVELTPQGEKKFRKLYVHRPVPVKAEGCALWFDCSHFQIVQYFERFGKDARVIYPESVRNAIVSFHRRALAAYGELPPKQDPM